MAQQHHNNMNEMVLHLETINKKGQTKFYKSLHRKQKFEQQECL